MEVLDGRSSWFQTPVAPRTSMVLAVSRGLVYTLGFFRLVYWCRGSKVLASWQVQLVASYGRLLVLVTRVLVVTTGLVMDFRILCHDKPITPYITIQFAVVNP